MYGLREAPATWQKVVRNLMDQLGFQGCVTVPCAYHHARRDLVVVAHVDDFLVSGPLEELARLRAELKGHFDCDGEVLGDGPDEVSKVSFLGRTISLTPGGLEWRGDSKMVETFLHRAGVGALSPSSLHHSGLATSAHASIVSIPKTDAVASAHLSDPTGKRSLASRYRCAASTKCAERRSAFPRLKYAVGLSGSSAMASR